MSGVFEGHVVLIFRTGNFLLELNRRTSRIGSAECREEGFIEGSEYLPTFCDY